MLPRILTEQDNGNKIFKAFYRADKSRSKETGRLGSSIADWITNALPRMMEVGGESNQGPTLTGYLTIQSSKFLFSKVNNS